jgi:hypothetical protein
MTNPVSTRSTVARRINGPPVAAKGLQKATPKHDKIKVVPELQLAADTLAWFLPRIGPHC